jgi:hypothetical protein
MSQVIIYNQDNGIPAVVVPTQEALDIWGIEAIAIKDVPAGKPYKIVDAAELPDAPQETWTVDEADLTDGFGGESNLFPEPEVIEEEHVEVQNAD